MTAPERMCAPISEPFSSTQTLNSRPLRGRELLEADRGGQARRGPPPTMTTSNSIASRSTARRPLSPGQTDGAVAANSGLYNAQPAAIFGHSPSGLATPLARQEEVDEPPRHHPLCCVASRGSASWPRASSRIVASLQPEVRWDHPGARLVQRPDQRLPAAADDPPRMEARPHAHGIFLGFMSLLLRKLQLLVIGYDENFASRASGRRCSPRSRTSSRSRVLLAVGYALLAPPAAEAGAARAQPRGTAGPVADRDDHGHRLRVRRIPLRAASGDRPRHRARAQLRARRQRASPRRRGLRRPRSQAG